MLNRAFLVVLLFTPAAFSQATVEYGGAVSNSSGAGAAVGSAIGRTIQHAGDTLGGTTRQSQSEVVGIPRTNPSSIETAMRANQQKLETLAGEKGATIQIASVPSKTTLYVDGLVVAFAPTDVRLPIGKHMVELRHPAFLPWREQLSLSGGETVRLEPKLVRDRTKVFVSFDK